MTRLSDQLKTETSPTFDNLCRTEHFSRVKHDRMIAHQLFQLKFRHVLLEVHVHEPHMLQRSLEAGRVYIGRPVTPQSQPLRDKVDVYGLPNAEVRRKPTAWNRVRRQVRHVAAHQISCISRLRKEVATGFQATENLRPPAGGGGVSAVRGQRRKPSELLQQLAERCRHVADHVTRRADNL